MKKEFRCFDCVAEKMSFFQALWHAVYATLTQKMDFHEFGEERRTGSDRRHETRYQVGRLSVDERNTQAMGDWQ